MANDFYTADQVAAVALRLVEEDAYLSALISRNIVDPLKGGGTSRAIELRVPNALVARDRDIDDKTSAVIFDEIQETRITVSADQRAYSGVSLSDGDLSLNLTSFADQVLSLQTEAVTERVEKEVGDTLAAIPVLDGAEAASLTFDPDRPERLFTQLRKILRKRGVPQTGIRAVVGPEVYAALLDSKAIVDASESGSTAALREGNVGSLRGFQIVESTRVGDTDVSVFHRDVLSLSVKPPLPPQGAGFATTLTSAGMGLRYVRGFDMRKTEDLSLVDTMFAVVPLPMFKVSRDYTTHAATVTQLDAGKGASLRVDVADLPEPTATPEA